MGMGGGGTLIMCAQYRDANDFGDWMCALSLDCQEALCDCEIVEIIDIPICC